MSVRRSNAIITKITRDGSISTNTKNIKPNPVKTKNTQIKSAKLIDKKNNLKVDYKSPNYFYNDEDYEDYPDNKLKYSINNYKYNNETSDSYITVEHEDGNIKYIPKNDFEYKRSSPPYNIEKNDDYEQENSEDSDNIDNNYENDYEYEQEVINNQMPMNRYNHYRNINKYNLTQNNNKKAIKNVSKNVISRTNNIEFDYTKDIKRKGRTPGGNYHNGINNKSTTTNNTYNNNIYYINPVNKNEENNYNKLKKANTNKKNSVYKNVDITINKKKDFRDIDYFKMNNISKLQRQNYINAAILIQSIFRGYLIKIKLYNNVNLYVCCKRSIGIMEKIFMKRKRRFWKIYKNKMNQLFYSDILNSKLSLNILKEYVKTHKNSKEKKIVSFHKELGDSFNIVVDNNQKENTEKKLKSKLNDVIKENNELKNKLVDNKNIEEKMKNLIDENKKNQNINAIIMKDNLQLARKLKDIQDYRNINLFVDNQPSIDFTQKQQMQIDVLLKNNDIYLNKLKNCLLGKIINKKIENKNYILKDNFNKYKYIAEKMRNKDKENKIKKELYLQNLIGILENQFKLLKQKSFWNLYYVTIILDKEIKSKNNLKNENLKNIINNKEQKVKMFLYKEFFKYYSNIIKSKNEESQKEEVSQKKEVILTKIIKNYDKNKKLLYKIIMDKWNLKSKIMALRAAARDKKKKRKLKKKTNKLIYQQNIGLADKNKNSSKLCQSIQEFSYVVSNGTVIKESSSHETASINIKKNIKESTSSDKINKKNKLENNLGIKKINSVNEFVTHNKIKEDNKLVNKENENVNIKCNPESEEDSGDSFGLEDD